MKTEKNWLFLILSLLAILAGLCFSSPQVFADAPKGVMKGVVHFGIAGDWLDPSITLANQSAYFPLQV